ncbi:hypothetical protein M8818_003046 [Zalaria obscura]|uniref:Uncharacterized protein n=1 Tax=Zalaria obscura TaxID=2024903 RepID=A0ACC3SHR5_9PEZI
MGAYEWTREIANDAERFPVRREHHPWRYDTASEQLAVWAAKMWAFVNPWSFEIKEGDQSLDIDGHLWTIPVEFVTSISRALPHPTRPLTPKTRLPHLRPRVPNSLGPAHRTLGNDPLLRRLPARRTRQPAARQGRRYRGPVQQVLLSPSAFPSLVSRVHRRLRRRSLPHGSARDAARTLTRLGDAERVDPKTHPAPAALLDRVGRAVAGLVDVDPRAAAAHLHQQPRAIPGQDQFPAVSDARRRDPHRRVRDHGVLVADAGPGYVCEEGDGVCGCGGVCACGCGLGGGFVHAGCGWADD